MTQDFNPLQHNLCETRYFEDFEVGEQFLLPSRTMGESHFTAFQVVSGDNHPIHYDLEHCKRHGHPQLLAHGLQVVSLAAAGAGMFPHMTSDSLIAFIEQSSKFLGPVYVGDTVYPALTITELKAQNTTGVITMGVTIHNQRRELVLEGMQKYLVKKRPV